MKLSHLAETLKGSEIIRLAAVIREKIQQGQKIYNFTIGDFDPAIFPIPAALEEEIIASYRAKNTHYPPAEGIPELRRAVSRFIGEREHLDYDPDSEILISAGGRPLIYATYQAIVDEGEQVIYAVPSWNNNHYTQFVNGKHIVVETSAENNFMPVAAGLKPLLKDAVLLALCSPLNPTGTAFSRRQLEEICNLVAEENRRRGETQKKLYILFDQIYWTLTFGETVHYDPVSLNPELRGCTVFVDGMSKAFAATGVRVGWALGPAPVIAKMKAILSHVGAWSPMAEQKAAAAYLVQKEKVDHYLQHFRQEVQERLQKIYEGFMSLKKEGLPVDAIPPQAAIYLTVKLNLKGRKTATGKTLENQEAVTAYILDEAGLAVVPFYAFGASRQSPWYRLSVGTCKKEEIEAVFTQLRDALKKLS